MLRGAAPAQENESPDEDANRAGWEKPHFPHFPCFRAEFSQNFHDVQLVNTWTSLLASHPRPGHNQKEGSGQAAPLGPLSTGTSHARKRGAALSLRAFTVSISDLRLPAGSVVKNLPASAGDKGLIPRSGKSGEGMATHSSVLAWEIPWTEEPGRL